MKELAARFQSSLESAVVAHGWRRHRGLLACDLGGEIVGWASIAASARSDGSVWIPCNLGVLSPRLCTWSAEALPRSGSHHGFAPSLVRALVTFDSVQRPVFALDGSSDLDSVLHAMTELWTRPATRWLEAHATHEALAAALVTHSLDRRLRHGCMSAYIANGPAAATTVLEGVRRELDATRSELSASWIAVVEREITAMSAALATGPSAAAEKRAMTELARVQRLSRA